MEKKNQVLMSVLGVFALVIVTVGVSYAFFTYTRTSQYENTVTAGSLDFGFTDESQAAVTLENAMPIANATAEATSTTTDNVAVYDFKVAYNTTGAIDTTYTITLVEEGTGTLNKDLVKVALFENGTNLGTKTLTNALATNWVTDKVITSGTTNTYSLRMWIDASVAGFAATDNTTGIIVDGDNYTHDGQTVTWSEAGKTVSVKVRVDATGTAK